MLPGERHIVIWDAGEKKNKSVANPLAEKGQNIKGPNCRSTSNTNSLTYILKTKNLFLQTVGLVPNE